MPNIRTRDCKTIIISSLESRGHTAVRVKFILPRSRSLEMCMKYTVNGAGQRQNVRYVCTGQEKIPGYICKIIRDRSEARGINMKLIRVR